MYKDVMLYGPGNSGGGGGSFEDADPWAKFGFKLIATPRQQIKDYRRALDNGDMDAVTSHSLYTLELPPEEQKTCIDGYLKRNK